MDDDEVLFVIVYSFPRMLHVCCSFLKYKFLCIFVSNVRVTKQLNGTVNRSS
jgi:hypothetical protein